MLNPIFVKFIQVNKIFYSQAFTQFNQLQTVDPGKMLVGKVDLSEADGQNDKIVVKSGQN